MLELRVRMFTDKLMERSVTSQLPALSREASISQHTLNTTPLSRQSSLSTVISNSKLPPKLLASRELRIAIKR